MVFSRYKSAIVVLVVLWTGIIYSQLGSGDSFIDYSRNEGKIEAIITTTGGPWRGAIPINQTVSGPYYPEWWGYEEWGLYVGADASKLVGIIECTSNFTLSIFGESVDVDVLFPEADNVTIENPDQGNYFVDISWDSPVGNYNLTIFLYYGRVLTSTTNVTVTQPSTPSIISESSTIKSTTSPISSHESSSTIPEETTWEDFWNTVLAPLITFISMVVIAIVLALYARDRKLRSTRATENQKPFETENHSS